MVTYLPELVIDDESSIRATRPLVLTELGCSVRSASDGFPALSLIQERNPNILLSDLKMPGMSGFELLSVALLNQPTIYVTATSGASFGRDEPKEIAADTFYEAPIVEHRFRILSSPPQTCSPSLLSIQNDGNRRHLCPFEASSTIATVQNSFLAFHG